MGAYEQAAPLESRKYISHRFSPEIERRIKELSIYDNWHVPLALLSDYLIVALCIAATVMGSWYFYPIAMILIGARQRGISSMLHETSHGVGTKSRGLRGILGTVLTAYPIFQTYHAYRISHVLIHHSQLGRREHDPDLRFFIDQDVFKPQHPAWYFVRTMILPFVGARTLSYLVYLLKNRLAAADGDKEASISADLRRKRRLEYIPFSIYWLTVIGVCQYFGVMTELAVFWVLPYLTWFQIIGWYIELSEHSQVIEGENIDIHMSRNRKSRGLELFLTGVHNDHFHLEHHLNPSTPFWALPKARGIRLADEKYAAVDAATGGLFVQGPGGVASAMRTLLDSNRNRYESRAYAQGRAAT